MSPTTVERLRMAITDVERVAYYRSRVAFAGEHDCWPWSGAIVAKGSGRMYIGDDYVLDRHGYLRRKTFSVIAYRFGFALLYGVDLLLDVPLFSHRCDNPLCQNVVSPEHCQPSTPRENRLEYVARRDAIRGALADVRGSSGRSHAIRDALRDGADVGAVAAAGIRAEQAELFAEPTRRASSTCSWQRQRSRSDRSGQADPGLFDVG